ncbi:core histone macro-H2A.1 [Trichonephila clavipes]|nr:core histone macro-H2A.1 [Trichonephila clavipes]
MSEWDYTNERVLFWMDLNGDFEWVCSTITSQNIYGRAPTIILLTMRPSRLLVKIRCHVVPSTRKRSAVRKIPVFRSETIGEMQESLNKISVWCKKWKLATSPEKRV